MKQKLFIIILLVITISLIVKQTSIVESLTRGTAYAVGDLSVNWGVPEGQPIFTITNLAPGETETHSVHITNNSSLTRPVGVRGIKTHETGTLSSQLIVKISRNGTDVYGGTTGIKTLANFFIESASAEGIVLSTLSSGQNTTYLFSVTFDQNAGNAYQNTTIQFDLKIGVSAAIPVACNITTLTGKNIIFGTSGNDTINGTNNDDLIFTLEGNDKINGSNGSDCIVGGNGNLTLNGSNGNDVISAGNGINSIDGSNGNDIITTGNGGNKVDGGNGNDTITTGSGNDKVVGGNENDTIFTNGGNDTIDTGNGNDTAHAGSGNDGLTGGNGNDTLIGDLDNDSTHGGLGTDICQAEIKSSCEL